VGTGLYMGTVAKTTTTPRSYFNASAVGLALAGLIAVLATALIASDRSRVLYFALAPTVVLYSFHNWDLLAVALTALAFLAFQRRRDGPAGAALGAGASSKLYPAFLLPVFMIVRWRDRDRTRDSVAPPGSPRVRRAWHQVANFVRPSRWMLGVFAAVTLVMNVPVMIANKAGWWYPWAFQSRRFTNFETVWYMVYRHLNRFVDQTFWFDPGPYPKLLNAATAAMFLIGSGLLIWRELKRERFRAANVSFGILLIWLITAKVFSPQYMLWLLPFFALVEIPWYGFVGFAIVDGAVWAAISAYFLTLSTNPAGGTTQLNLLEAAVFARYAVLGVLLWMTRRSRERVLWLRDEPVSRPAPATPALASES
jgi:Glycosyltransferase family 87